MPGDSPWPADGRGAGAAGGRGGVGLLPGDSPWPADGWRAGRLAGGGLLPRDSPWPAAASHLQRGTETVHASRSPATACETWTTSCPNGPVQVHASRSGSRRPRGVDANRPCLDAGWRPRPPPAATPTPAGRNPDPRRPQPRHPPAATRPPPAATPAPASRNLDTRQPQLLTLAGQSQHPGARTRLGSRNRTAPARGPDSDPTGRQGPTRRRTFVHTSPLALHQARRLDEFVPGWAG